MPLTFSYTQTLARTALPSLVAFSMRAVLRFRNHETVSLAVANHGCLTLSSCSSCRYGSYQSRSGPRLRSCQLVVNTPPKLLAFSINGRVAALASSSDRFIYEE